MCLSRRLEPDWSGRWTWSQTPSHSTIAAITGSRKSFGCGLVKRMRSMPGTASQARRSSPNSVLIAGARSRPQELTFWPSSVISLTPSRASALTSATTSPGRRLCSRPRTAGTMQYAHLELQPIDTCTHAWNGRSRRIGSWPAKERSSSPKRPRLREVRGEALVRFLPDRARVEDDHVRVDPRDRLAEAEVLEHALDALRVVSVHLAAEGRDVVAPQGETL